MYNKFLSIIKNINPDILNSNNLNLIDDGLLDSLGVMKLISVLEENFSIDFDPNDISEENFSSVENIWNLVQKCLKEKESE